MTKRKMFSIYFMAFSVIASFYFLLPNFAFAEGWLEKKVSEASTYIAKLIFEPMFTGALAALKGVLVTPDLKSIPYVDKIKTYTQYIAVSLAVLQFTFQIWKANTAIWTRGENPPHVDIIYRAMLSVVLIYGLPEILLYMIKMNAIIVEGLASVGVSVDGGTKLGGFPSGTLSIMVVVFIIWACALVGLLISNGIRMGELVFLYILGPILAVSYAGKGEALQMWITQAVAVTFTQSIQFLMIGTSFNLMANIEVSDWVSMILPIGVTIVAIKTPSFLKQFLYSSGSTGAISGGAKQYASTRMYAKMMQAGAGR